MAKIITVINGKGGVAKTTTTKFLIKEALLRNKKVLAIDFDPKQSSLSAGFDITPYPASPKTTSTLTDSERDLQALNAYNGENNLVKIFQGSGRPTPIKTTIDDNLWFLPAAKELEGVANACSSGRDLKLKQYLKSIEKDFDYIFIDTNPGITVLQNNAIIYADILVMPAQAESNAAEGMKTLLGEIASLMEEYDSSKPNSFFIIPSMVIKNSTTHNVVADDFKGIVPHTKTIPILSSKNVEILTAIPLKEVFRKTDLAEGVYFIQDFINLYEPKEKKMFKDEQANSSLAQKSIMSLLKNIADKIL